MTTETETELSYEKPLPPVLELTKPFWDGCREGVLQIQFCNICDLPWFPPAEACPRCLQDDWEWRPISGQGNRVVMDSHVAEVLPRLVAR